MQEKPLQSKKDLIGTHWNPFLIISVLADFFINTIFFIYVPTTYGILAILFFKHKVKLIKPSR